MQFCDCDRHRPGRRAFLGAVATAALGCAAAGVAPMAPARAADPVARTALTPDQALQLMKEGNDNYRTDAPFRGAQGRERRVELARG
jgi:carbonic anhydrase